MVDRAALCRVPGADRREVGSGWVAVWGGSSVGFGVFRIGVYWMDLRECEEVTTCERRWVGGSGERGRAVATGASVRSLKCGPVALL